ncbi:MAG: hypothetical protein IJ021_00235 [Clostridia bacterium]|nr:hypothetical protein [Clostridia bacterium]
MPTKRMNKKIIVPLLLAALLAIAAIFGGVYAKYIRGRSSDGHISAPNFYFESDYLVDGGKEYTINSSVDSITFSIKNFADDYRVSEVDIVYDVEVESDDSTFNLKINNSEVKEGAFTKDTKETDTIILSNIKAGETYTVTVKGKGGFEKTLSATFKVNPAEDKVYKHISQTEHYVLLTVWTEKVSGTATVEMKKTGLIPDSTDARMSTWTVPIHLDGEKYTDATGYTEYSSHTYRFFKKTNGTQYTIDDFTVTVNSKNAIEGTP